MNRRRAVQSLGGIALLGMTRKSIATVQGMSGFARFGSHVGSGGAPTFATHRPSGVTTIFDRQWNTTDPTAGTLPPATAGVIDSYGSTWNAANHPPLIDTVTNLTTAIGSATIPPLPDAAPTAMAIHYPYITFTGSISGTTLTVPSGTPNVNNLAITGTGVTSGTYVTGGSGTSWTVNNSQTVGPVAMVAAMRSGYAPMNISGPSATTGRTFYLCCFVLFPSNWTNEGNNIKFWQLTQANSQNDILMLEPDGSSTQLAWLVLQPGGAGGGGSDCYLGGNPPLGNFTAVSSLVNGSYDQVGYATGSQLGVWLMLEWLCIEETTPGVSGDGIFKSWVTNMSTGVSVLANYWNNLNYYNSGATGGEFGNNFQLIPYWGGGGSNATANHYFCMGRTQLAIA